MPSPIKQCVNLRLKCADSKVKDCESKCNKYHVFLNEEHNLWIMMPAATETFRLSTEESTPALGWTKTLSGTQVRRSGGIPAPSLPKTKTGISFNNY